MSNLFTPLTLGSMQLTHRVVLAPLTRSRSPTELANDNNVLYYHQRASKGGLLITEGTWCSKTARGYDYVPGILTPEHGEAWKKVTKAVHSKGGYIFAQLWHVGRVSRSRFQPENKLPVTATATPSISKTHDASRDLSIPEIEEIIEEFRVSAIVAREAGFDGVEVHAAHGYLLDQFLQTNTNKRTDCYGGSFENRGRFLFACLDAVLKELPSTKVALRLSPYSTMFGVSCDDTFEMFKYVFERLHAYKFVYLSLTEPIWGQMQIGPEHSESQLNHLLPFVCKDTAVLLTGGYLGKSGNEAIATNRAKLIGFGRPFITNPDLPERLMNNIPLTSFADSTGFYGGDENMYTTYKTWTESESENYLKELKASL